MTSLLARISRTRFCVTIVCALVAFCVSRSDAEAQDRSNGILERLGMGAPQLLVDEPSLDESVFESAVSERESLFTKLALLESTTSLSSDAALVKAVGEDRRLEGTTVDYYGNGYSFSEDVVMRGSVSLPSFSAIQFWGNAYSGGGHIRPVGDDSRIKRNNTGASLGLNLPLGAATITGFYNYHRDREFFAPGRVQQTDNSFGLAFYYNNGGFYASGSGLYGDDRYKTKSSAFETLEFRGEQTAAYIETGYNMMNGGMFVLEPFASYHYANVRHGAFDPTLWSTESGRKKYNSCTATLGSRVNLNLAGLDCFTLQGRMAWVAELRRRTESITTFNYGRVPATFTPASPYYVGQGGGDNLFWAGAGLRLSLWGMLAVAVDYDCFFNKRQTLNEGSLGLLFGF